MNRAGACTFQLGFEYLFGTFVSSVCCFALELIVNRAGAGMPKLAVDVRIRTSVFRRAVL